MQLEGNACEITWEMVPPMKGDPVGYVLQVLVGRESEYKQVGKWSRLYSSIGDIMEMFWNILCCFLLPYWITPHGDASGELWQSLSQNQEL